MQNKYNKLNELFSDQTDWHLSHVKCAVLLIISLIKVQSVSFVKLAEGFESQCSYDSSYRRIQRFFASFEFSQVIVSRIIFKLLPSKPPYMLCMDRTNWKFGSKNINILMLSICYHGVSIPIFWELLDKRGNSNTEERKNLLMQYFSEFGTGTIEAFMADREFIGKEWAEWLISYKISFHIRIRENMQVKLRSGKTVKAFWLFNRLKPGEWCNYKGIVSIKENMVYLSGAKVLDRKGKKHEFIIIASFSKQDRARLNYKERWQIESMFRAMKTGGFNLEDTHVTELERIKRILAIVAVAFVWAYISGIDKHKNIRPIKVKKHGRKAFSFFKYGLIRLAEALLSAKRQSDFKECIKLLSCT